VPNLLEIDNLRTHIRMRHSTVEAVDGVSLTIQPGETVGLVGESGCGKSLTGLSVMRLLPPGGRIVGGSVKLSGRELTDLSAAEMRQVRGGEVAMVFQDPMTSLDPTMTIGDQIAEPVRVHRRASKRQALDRAAEVLALVGMPSPRAQLGAYPHQLSGGLRQRAMIAMALSCEPKLLIADEPTTALDVTIQAQILALLDDLKQQMGMGMLLITHDMGVIAGRASRVLVMYAGRIVEAADTEAVFSGMRHPYTQALLESIPSADSSRDHPLYSIPGLPPDLTRPPAGCRFAPRCRYVQQQCRDDDPQPQQEEAGHAYACFFPVGIAEQQTVSHAVPAQAVPPETASTKAGRSPSPEPLLAVSHLVREFPITKGILQRRIGSVQAVSDVSFEVGHGETFGLVGESGCGKTTLGRMITALERPDAGSVTLNGQDITALRRGELRKKRRSFQLMFQDPYASLDPRMRIRAVLREPLAAHHMGSRAEQEERLTRLLLDVGLPVRSLSLYPHEFSGGQRQRIGLARALTLEPALVVADEPVSALDVSIRSQVLNLMRRLQDERDLTYILISHDLSVVRYLADRVAVMYLGKLAEIGPADEVYEHPAHPYTASLLEAIPVPDPARERQKRPAVAGELPSAADPPSGCRFRTRCPRSQDICAREEPVMRPFGTTAHIAACHFPLAHPLPVDTAPDDVAGSPGNGEDVRQRPTAQSEQSQQTGR
jgi:oligopeptide/dipeptide ABC transporter ATP-binding protein